MANWEDKRKTSPGLPVLTQTRSFESPDKTLRIRLPVQRPEGTGAATGSLLVLAGSPADIGRHVVVRDALVIGRAEGLRLRDGNISRRHSEVRRNAESYFLVDLGSTNGTLLNGTRIAKPQKLNDGDTILLGQTVIKFHLINEADNRLTGRQMMPPWILLVVDARQAVHDVVDRSIADALFGGRAAEAVHAYSAEEALSKAKQCTPTLLAGTLVDMEMGGGGEGVHLTSELRHQYGNALQIIVCGERKERSQGADYHFLPKEDITPDSLRALFDVAIRNFRHLTGMGVLCNTLSRFASLFESASDNHALNQSLKEALKQYASFWRFDYYVISDLNVEVSKSEPRNLWQQDVLNHMRSVEWQVYRSVEFQRLDVRDGSETWGCVIKPIGGRFTSAFAIRSEDPPPGYLLENLQNLMRAWALARTSLQIRQIIMDEQRIRFEMDKERREGIAKMVAGVAHQVNTPLSIASTAACTIVQILSRHAHNAENLHSEYEDLQQSAQLIVRGVERAGELIQTFKRLSVGQLFDVLEQFDLVQSIKDIVRLYESQAQSKVEIHIHDHTEPDCTVWDGYAGFLSQVLINLLTNVERYAYPAELRSEVSKQRPHRHMTVDITVSSRMVGDVPEFAISFTDYGVGIASHRLPYVFDPFYTTGRDSGATGLGLSIVHNIVTNIFGGTVRCQSTENHGTTVFTTFSHCELEKNVRAAEKVMDASTDSVQIFRDFIALQRKFIQEGNLVDTEQLRLTDAAQAVDRYLEARFKSNNKRRSPRIPTRRRVTLYYNDTWEDSELRDISEGGAMHVLNKFVPKGASVMLRYWSDPNIVIDGEVVTSTEIKSLGQSQAGTEWQIGLKFLSQNEENKRNLKLLIAEVMLEYWA